MIVLNIFLLATTSVNSSEEIEPLISEAEKIDALFTNAFASNSPGATVVVIRDERVVFEKAYGLANIAKKLPNRLDTKYKIGSLTKQFVALTILRFIEKGMMSLSEPLSKYFPNQFSYGDKVLIEHLLNHTSGIPNYTELDNWGELKVVERTPEELCKLFKEHSLEFDPGQQTSYSNSGYVLLGMIIEKITDTPLESYIQSSIFKPLGMSDTEMVRGDKVIDRLAVGYSSKNNTPELAEDIHISNAFAAGSIVSTVSDLVNWNQAIQTGELLNKQSLNKAWSKQNLSGNMPPYYGFGWVLASVQGIESIEHAGGIDGFSSFAIALPEKRVYVAILSNLEQADTEYLAVKAAALAIGKPFSMPRKKRKSFDELKQYAGEYLFSDGRKRLVYSDAGYLFIAHKDKTHQQQLLEIENDRYYFDEMISIRFERNCIDVVTRLVFETRYGDMWRAKRKEFNKKFQSTQANCATE